MLTQLDFPCFQTSWFSNQKFNRIKLWKFQASKVSKADGWIPVVVRSKFGEMKQPGETLSKDNGAAGYKVGNGVKFPLKTQFSNSVSSIFIADRVGESPWEQMGRGKQGWFRRKIVLTLRFFLRRFTFVEIVLLCLYTSSLIFIFHIVSIRI